MSICIRCDRQMHPADASVSMYCIHCIRATKSPQKVRSIVSGNANTLDRKCRDTREASDMDRVFVSAVDTIDSAIDRAAQDAE